MLLLQAPAGVASQEPYSPLVPKGHLRFSLAGAYSSHAELYQLGGSGGGRGSIASVFSGPVGSRALPFLAATEAAVEAAAAGEPSFEDGYQASLGRMSSVVTKASARVPLSLEVGVFDWLTVGAMAPLVQNETEFSAVFGADLASANTGFGPGVDDPAVVSSFMAGLNGSIGAYDLFRSQLCAADPASDACLEATGITSQARIFHGALARMYGGLFTPISTSGAGRALAARLAMFAQLFEAAGITTLPGPLPLAQTLLTAEDVEELVTNPEFGIGAAHPFENWRSLWRLGDVEVSASARLPWTLGGMTLGGGATVRLPTGAQDDPAHFFDSGSGDGQMDVELRWWMNGLWMARTGLWAEARYGTQLRGSTVRRVSDPGTAFALQTTQTTLDWTPGDYQLVEVAPWYRVAEELTAVAGLRYFRQGPDAFSVAVAPVEEGVAQSVTHGVAQGVAPLDPAILAAASGGSLSELVLGMVFNRAGGTAGRPHANGGEEAGAGAADGERTAGEGGANQSGGADAGVQDEAGADSQPLEIRVMYRRAVAGSGPMPVRQSLEVGFRLFRGVWR